MTILYSGGGTLGSVSPLLAVHAEMNTHASYRGIWVGLDIPKERAFVAGRGLSEFHITSPRLRNFESQGIGLTQLTFPFRFIAAFFQSLRIIRNTKPHVHFSAGSFVSIPVALACFVSRVPNVVHQQDLLPGLANRVMARLARTVTVAFPVLAPRFGAKAVVVGNPVRTEILHGDADAARARYGFPMGKPVVFVIGGSSGARGLNDMIDAILPEILSNANVLHMTGATHESMKTLKHESMNFSGYFATDFLGAEIADAYALADIVVSRAGLSTLTELGVLGKPTIVVPIPGSHQVDNAEYFASEGAIRVVRQGESAELLHVIGSLIADGDAKRKLSENAKRLFPVDAAKKITERIVDSSSHFGRVIEP